MASERRMINAWKLVIDLAKLERSGQYDHENVLAVIASQETVDAVEVVHGRWSGWRNAHCSICERFCTLAYIKDFPNYCPNCGAKMDGERKDNDTTKSC